jgi:iron-sulfur cluster assembly protein
MFQLTPAARDAILAAAEQSDAAGMAMRVAAHQDEQGRIAYGMGFDDEREDDQPLDFGGLTVLVGARSRAMLDGVVLDYMELEQGGGFVFAPLDAADASSADEGARGAAGGCGSGGCGSCGCH